MWTRTARFTSCAWSATPRPLGQPILYFKTNRPDVVIVPNGTIQELGIVYRVAKQMGIPVVTYEFGEQRQRIWMAQNGEVMRQETDALWAARNGNSLDGRNNWNACAALFASRQRAACGRTSLAVAGHPSQGGSQVRGQPGAGRPAGGAAGYQRAG